MKSFKLSKKERKRAKKFKRTQIEKNPHNLSHVSRWSYIITPSGIGTGLAIRDNIENEQIDITDFSIW